MSTTHVIAATQYGIHILLTLNFVLIYVSDPAIRLAEATKQESPVFLYSRILNK